MVGKLIAIAYFRLSFLQSVFNATAMTRLLTFLGIFCISIPLLWSQSAYLFNQQTTFDPTIPDPQTFLGYPIGSHHTRHDQIVSYFKELAELSDRAQFQVLGETYEHRPLIMLTVSHPDNLARLEAIQAAQVRACDPTSDATYGTDQPVLINLGYNVHGNEPSSSEAALMTAYYLVAGEGEEAQKFRKEAVIFIDPVINPDGRDRHTHWANMHKGSPMVSDPNDREHNEVWPGGRTNHYWFDLNRDWILLVHPESKSKLNWYHQWYPHVVTDFHEMGTNSTYFFEPMKSIGSLDPIMPEENYTTLNETFARYFTETMNAIGGFYFTKEVFDGTYPGYGSSYPDLQGGLGLLFEQASSRGHLQDSDTGPLSFTFTIRNQTLNSLATVRAAVENKPLLFNYQKEFFKSAISRAEADPVKAYIFGDAYDANRNKAFVDLLLRHEVAVYHLNQKMTIDGQDFEPGKAFVVPTAQPQYRIVQTMFETYDKYRDSVYYDASAWSLVNAYGLNYAVSNRVVSTGKQIQNSASLIQTPPTRISNYAYLMKWDDYFAPDALHYLQEQGLITKVTFRPFTIGGQDFAAGTILIPVAGQPLPSPALHEVVQAAGQRHQVPIFSVETGYSEAGIDLGSRWIRPLKAPKALMLVGEGISGYEAGEVWHLLDTRLNMPITKVDLTDMNRLDLSKYNTLVMVSGRYDFDSATIQKIRQWVAAGGTLITQRMATRWAIDKKLVREHLISPPRDTALGRKPFALAGEIQGAQEVGGTIFGVDLDLTHPLAFGYHQREIPIYRNSRVYLRPSKNPYSTVAQYLDDPHIDGFVSPENLEVIRGSAALLVSPIGRGRAILFTDNPNFRGTWYGTNKLFLNALFFGGVVRVP